MHHLYALLTQDGLTAQVAELNRNLVSQNNRMVAQFERLAPGSPTWNGPAQRAAG